MKNYTRLYFTDNYTLSTTSALAIFFLQPNLICPAQTPSDFQLKNLPNTQIFSSSPDVFTPEFPAGKKSAKEIVVPFFAARPQFNQENSLILSPIRIQTKTARLVSYGPIHKVHFHHRRCDLLSRKRNHRLFIGKASASQRLQRHHPKI